MSLPISSKVLATHDRYKEQCSALAVVIVIVGFLLFSVDQQRIAMIQKSEMSASAYPSEVWPWVQCSRRTRVAMLAFCGTPCMS